MTRHRLHLGGLGQGVSEDSLRQLLGSFGEVVGFDGLGKLDANGLPLRFAFVELETTDAQAQRCMSLLSGTMFKGSTLRIAPARPDYRGRLEAEWAAADQGVSKESEKELRRSRKRMRNLDGCEADEMVLMTKERLETVGPDSGWRKDPSTGLPIFPVIARPLRPILGLSPFDTTAPPNRAFRVRIDPAQTERGGRKRHLVGAREVASEMYKLGLGGNRKARTGTSSAREWECDDSVPGVAVWTLNGGEEEERVALAPRHHTPRDSSSPVAEPVLRHLRHRSPSLEPDDGDDISAALALERQAHLSLLRELAVSDTDVVLEDVHEGLRAAVERQKAREADLELGKTWMADAGVEVVRPAGGNLLRLRGGAGSESDDETSSTTSEEGSWAGLEESASSSTAHLAAGPGQGADSASSSTTLGGKTLPSISPEHRPADGPVGARAGAPADTRSLASMFRAQAGHAEGFSLGFDDLEMGEDPLVEPESEPIKDSGIHPSRLAALAGPPPPFPTFAAKTRPPRPIVPSHEQPLFFPYPFDDEDYEPSGTLGALGIVKGDERDEGLRSRCRFHAVGEGQRLSGWKTFLANGTMEDVTKTHDETKGELTRGFKKRRKEAVKSAKNFRRKGRPHAPG